MRRSNAITLTLLATVSVVALAGCSEEQKQESLNRVFTDLAACEAVMDPAQCRRDFAAAEDIHTRQAPKFNNASDCQTVSGACREAKDENGTSVWVPLMAGFVAGALVNNMMTPAQPVTRFDCRYAPNDPYCRNQSRSGGFVYVPASSYTSYYRSGPSVGTTSGPRPTAFSPTASAPRSAVSSSATARGGFGSTASSASASS